MGSHTETRCEGDAAAISLARAYDAINSSYPLRIDRPAMADRKPPRISSRKHPRQARSNQLVSAILEAAAQVLAAEGAQRLTTARVAERAGVSVGSLYQYFPNKAAILFRLQSDEWRQTTDLLSTILKDVERPPHERLRTLVQAFIRSECEEAQMRIALNDAAPLYRDAPEAKKARATGKRTFQAFMREVLPNTSRAARVRAGDLIGATLSTVGKQFSESPRTLPEIKTYAEAMSDMFLAYIERINRA
ncbi:TetR family transcriptional regulator [Lysobacter antibioticus]|nr:TetR family transcriptional regulator [Lysobacter antibioticus]